MRKADLDQLPDVGEVTAVLQEWSGGDTSALGKLLPLVYDQLRALARGRLAGERAGHTLQPTALVHEAYLRLVDQKSLSLHDRTHFFAIMARVMRRVLVDHARTKQAERRGGGQWNISFDDCEIAPEANASGLIALDTALEKLAADYPRQGKVVEMKFFAGMLAEEIGEALQVSEKTVLRDWNFAKLWLTRELGAEGSHDAGTR